MKWAMIADDLTGANDSGVQLARDGLTTKVFFDFEAVGESGRSYDALVIDTDSRLLSQSEAYKIVFRAAQQMIALQPEIVYKKMDSTLRGNVGAELDAMYDAVQPEFIVIAPSFPANGRTMENGMYAVHGTPLHESDAAKDPATPVHESHIPSLLAGQTKRSLRLFRTSDLLDEQQFAETIEQCKADGQMYLLFDAETSADLRLCVERMLKVSSKLVWAGSAGLAQMLSAVRADQVERLGLAVDEADTGSAGHSDLAARQRTWINNDQAISGSTKQKKSGQAIARSAGPLLIVCGSVHQRTQQQLNVLLRDEHVAAVEVRGEILIAEQAEGKIDQIERAAAQLLQHVQAGKDVVLHTCAEPQSIEQTALVAAKYDVQAIGPTISRLLGKITQRWVQQLESPPQGLLLTGGDTARKVCHELGLTSFELIDEVEPGIPYGYFHGSYYVKGITKSGGFGGEHSLRTALEHLKEGI